MLENHNLKTYERRITPLERLFRRSPYSIVTMVARIKGNVSESMLVNAVSKFSRDIPTSGFGLWRMTITFRGLHRKAFKKSQ